MATITKPPTVYGDEMGQKWTLFFASHTDERAVNWAIASRIFGSLFLLSFSFLRPPTNCIDYSKKAVTKQAPPPGKSKTQAEDMA